MRLEETWDWVRTSPLLWLSVTLASYEIGRKLRDRTHHPLAQPMLVCIAICGGLISVLHVEYRDYVSATGFIAFLLGPATVALAVPLHRQFGRLRGLAVPMFVGLLAGALVSATTGLLLTHWLGGGEDLARTMAPKAATTPVSIALAERIGGIPELTATFAIAAGMIGAIAGPAVLRLARIRDPRARGLAIGAVSHGVGTSRLLRTDRVAGAFSGLAMGLTALATSLTVEPLTKWLL